jgi:hypothetical protein
MFWEFKDNSELQTYLETNDVNFPTFFTPKELFDQIVELACSNAKKESKNSMIIFLDKDQQKLFKSTFLYKPDIIQYCIEHIEPVSFSKNVELQQECIDNELYIKTPTDLIYNNNSAIFWLHPTVNSVLFQNQKHSWTWNELNEAFLNSCISDKKNFKRIDDLIFSINADSKLNDVFDFKVFHQYQIEDILKIITKYLGKSKKLENICPNLTFENDYCHALNVIDDIINQNNNICIKINSKFKL